MTQENSFHRAFREYVVDYIECAYTNEDLDNKPELIDKIGKIIADDLMNEDHLWNEIDNSILEIIDNNLKIKELFKTKEEEIMKQEELTTEQKAEAIIDSYMQNKCFDTDFAIVERDKVDSDNFDFSLIDNIKLNNKDKYVVFSEFKNSLESVDTLTVFKDYILNDIFENTSLFTIVKTKDTTKIVNALYELLED